MTEQHRHECEARFWVAETGGKADEVDALIARIEKRRGKPAAERLREEMRRQWLIQRGKS
jgi:hypothetical protein